MKLSCSKCNKVVVTLRVGSTVASGITVICKDCNKTKTKKKTK